MKPRHIVVINLFFIGLVLFSSGMVYQFMTGQKPLSMLKSIGHHSTVASVKTATCTNQPPFNLNGASTTALQTLSVYQTACHSRAASTMMLFTSMPATEQEAADYAKADAQTLKDFAAHGVRPLVIAEPSEKNGTTLDYATFANGGFNSQITTYFQTLKDQGITDTQLGIWNPFPEANLPYWNDNQPQYFAPAVNNYLGILKQMFPGAHTSIMLNSATYRTTDFDWANGEYDSLLQYVKGITPGLVEYAGMQGFPWMSPQGGNGAIVNAAEFLAPDLLKEMADSLGTKKVWFNTGTFSAKYTLDPSQTVTMTPERRKAVTQTINDQAVALQKSGYTVAVNIFAQDKSRTAEATNWSYWSAGKPFESPAAPVITDFINQLDQEHIDFWLFDN
jgi:hypothetical protein